LLTFKPDFVTNWEVGAKGQLGVGLTYTAALFYEKLRDIQIETSTPVDGYPLIVNGREATSKGVELEINGQLTNQLRGSLAYAYADATLQNSFTVPTTYGSIFGDAGDRLPGSAKNSLGGTLSYDIPLSEMTTVTLTGSANYKGSVVFGLPNSVLPVPERAGGYMLYNANAEVRSGSWTATLFADNLANKRAVLSQNFGQTTPDNRTMEYFVNQPRTVGLRIGYRF
jgi:outer membrane receptor protein involved in Fe transport